MWTYLYDKILIIIIQTQDSIWNSFYLEINNHMYKLYEQCVAKFELKININEKFYFLQLLKI